MRDFMVGNIAAGIVVVDGKAGTEAEFTFGEKLNISIGMSKAFDILYNLKGVAAAGLPRIPLLFVAKIDTVKLDLDPATVPAPSAAGALVRTSAEYERFEQVWRDPALTALGFSTGKPGIAQYIQKLMTTSWAALPVAPDSAYVVFVTKYMANWMAYADPAIARLTMSYLWLADQTPLNPDGTGGFRGTGASGWGEANFHFVLAHETGHIFGAPDEYAKSNCNTSATAGHLHIANSNCEVSNPASVDCLMKNNKETMCAATPGHWGWADFNGNGVLDVLEP